MLNCASNLKRKDKCKFNKNGDYVENCRIFEGKQSKYLIKKERMKDFMQIL